MVSIAARLLRAKQFMSDGWGVHYPNELSKSLRAVSGLFHFDLLRPFGHVVKTLIACGLSSFACELIGQTAPVFFVLRPLRCVNMLMFDGLWAEQFRTRATQTNSL